MALKLVDIAEVSPGQVLAQAVTNSEGAILCPAGFITTESSLNRLKNAGIEQIAVECDESESDIASSTESIENRLSQLTTRFEGIQEPSMLQLKAMIERHLNNLQQPVTKGNEP